MSRNHVALNAARWSRARRLTLKRDGYRCAGCGKAGRLEVHHVRELAKGGAPYAPENLKTVCRGCHIALTAKSNRRFEPPHVVAWRTLAAETV